MAAAGVEGDWWARVWDDEESKERVDAKRQTWFLRSSHDTPPRDRLAYLLRQAGADAR